jgi:hypothetical protein
MILKMTATAPLLHRYRTVPIAATVPYRYRGYFLATESVSMRALETESPFGFFAFYPRGFFARGRDELRAWSALRRDIGVKLQSKATGRRETDPDGIRRNLRPVICRNADFIGISRHHGISGFHRG